MPKKGVPSSVRNNQRLEEILTSGSFNKELQEGARAYFRTQAKKRAYLEYMLTGGLETQLPLIRKRFGLPERMEARSYLPLKHISHDSLVQPRSIQEILDWKKESVEKRLAFFRKISLSELNKFDFAVEWIAMSHNLDFTWHRTIADIVISGYYLAPYYNLEIRTKNNERALVLELTGTTTCEDISYAFESIRERQIEAFGRQKKSRYSKTRILLAELIRLAEKTVGKTIDYYDTETEKTITEKQTLKDAFALWEEEGRVPELTVLEKQRYEKKIRTALSRKRKLRK